MTLNLPPLWLEAAAKAAAYLALLLAIGTCGGRWLLLPRVRGLSAIQLQQCEQRLGRLVLTAALSLVGALVLRLAAHSTAVFGFAEALSIESLRVVALQSRWGEGWRVQMLAAAVAVSAAGLVRVQPRNGWVAVTAAVVTCCLSVPLLGHAAGATGRVALHAIHVGSAGLWLGSLAAILIACRPRAPFLRAFAPVAFSGAALLVGGGFVLALEYVGSLSNLWTTLYGRVISVKLALFGAVVACGYLNWRRWRAAIEATNPPGADAGGATRIAAVEVLLALGIVLVTALLSELEHS